MERSDICKCGHSIHDHGGVQCNHEVGGICVQHIHGGKCRKCKCKKFDARIRKRKLTEVEQLRSTLARVTEERDELKEHIKSLLGFLGGHELPLGFNSLAGQANSAISRIEEGE